MSKMKNLEYYLGWIGSVTLILFGAGIILAKTAVKGGSGAEIDGLPAMLFGTAILGSGLFILYDLIFVQLPKKRKKKLAKDTAD